MRFEISASRRPRPLSFSMAQFNNLRTLSRIASNHEDDLVASPMALTEEKSEHQQQRREEERQKKESAEESKHAQANHPSCANGGDMAEVDECCICLYALAPFQALFVAPCSHSFHFKCIRSLLRSYPGFQCPICRTYSDLEASVAIEPEEVMEKYGLKCKSFTPPTDVMFDATWSQPVNPALQQPASDTTSTTSSSPSSSSSSSAQSSSAAAANAAAQTAQEERPSGDQEEQQEEHHRQENQCQHQHQQQQHSDEEVQNSLSADQPPVQLQETRVATIDQQIATDDMSQDSPNDGNFIDRGRSIALVWLTDSYFSQWAIDGVQSSFRITCKCRKPLLRAKCQPVLRAQRDMVPNGHEQRMHQSEDYLLLTLWENSNSTFLRNANLWWSVTTINSSNSHRYTVANGLPRLDHSHIQTSLCDPLATARMPTATIIMIIPVVITAIMTVSPHALTCPPHHHLSRGRLLFNLL